MRRNIERLWKSLCENMVLGTAAAILKPRKISHENKGQHGEICEGGRRKETGSRITSLSQWIIPELPCTRTDYYVIYESHYSVNHVLLVLLYLQLKHPHQLNKCLHSQKKLKVLFNCMQVGATQLYRWHWRHSLRKANSSSIWALCHWSVVTPLPRTTGNALQWRRGILPHGPVCHWRRWLGYRHYFYHRH